jgi:hypothetical protein
MLSLNLQVSNFYKGTTIMKKLTKYSRAGKNGKAIVCPHCSNRRRVYHMAWDHLICSGCKAEVPKTGYLVPPKLVSTMKSPVILIISKTKRNEVMDRVMRLGGLDGYDASGTRAVVWSDGNTEDRLRDLLRVVGPIEGAELSVIDDPGLGIMLPGDFD